MLNLDIKPRTLLGPGPSNVHPRVLRAMSFPLVGHMDPQFLTLMNEIQDLLRYVFQTKNEFTIPVSGTGSASMEASMVRERVFWPAVNGYGFAIWRQSPLN